MTDSPEPSPSLKTAVSPVYGYVRSRAAKPRSTYRVIHSFGRHTGKVLGVSCVFARANTAAFKRSRCYHYAKVAGIVGTANYLRRFNPLVPYVRFLKSLSPKTSAYVLAYDNAIGLRPLYLLYGVYATYKGMQYFSDLGAVKAFGLSFAIASAEVQAIGTAAQIIRVPMRTFHAACMLPKVLAVDPAQIDRDTRSGRLFGWTVDYAHKLVGRRITTELNYRNRMHITFTTGYKAARKAFRTTLKPSL